MKALKEKIIIIRGAGEMATGVACRLYRSNFRRILMLETPAPLAVRRTVSFCEAIVEDRKTVEGIEAVKTSAVGEVAGAWAAGKIAVMVDPEATSVKRLRPDVLIDATLAKRNLGLSVKDARLVIALGPGFSAGQDCHLIVETNRGHDLGRVITKGSAEPDTGIPGMVGGFAKERVLRAPATGIFVTDKEIGHPVKAGEVVGKVGSAEVVAEIGGVLRGLIKPGLQVPEGIKIGDVDPRGNVGYCHTISDKARTLGGAVLEAILSNYNV